LKGDNDDWRGLTCSSLAESKTQKKRPNERITNRRINEWRRRGGVVVVAAVVVQQHTTTLAKEKED
jgi:hypothetical protein